MNPFRFFPRKIFLILILGLAALGSGFFSDKNRVIHVPDGDSLTVLTRKGEHAKVRLYGIDCPELHQNGGPEALAFTKNLALQQPVTLSTFASDQYHRDVALVRFEDGRTLNEELVRAGHAWVYRRYCDQPFCAAWLELERQAKKQGRGLWGGKNPLPPWQWRRAHPRQ